MWFVRRAIRPEIGWGSGRKAGVAFDGWARMLIRDGDSDLVNGVKLTVVLEFELALMVLDRDLQSVVVCT